MRFDWAHVKAHDSTWVSVVYVSYRSQQLEIAVTAVENSVTFMGRFQRWIMGQLISEGFVLQTGLQVCNCQRWNGASETKAEAVAVCARACARFNSYPDYGWKEGGGDRFIRGVWVVGIFRCAQDDLCFSFSFCCSSVVSLCVRVVATSSHGKYNFMTTPRLCGGLFQPSSQTNVADQWL